MNWQPIDTAPTDRTPILGYNIESKEMTVISRDSSEEWSDYWSIEVAGQYCDSAEFEPTHWMPLPEPPKPEVTP